MKTEVASETNALVGLEFFQKASKAAALFLLVAHTLGFLVTLIYLGRYGVLSLNLVKAQYVLTGCWFAFPFLLVSFPIAVYLETKTNLNFGCAAFLTLVVFTSLIVGVCNLFPILFGVTGLSISLPNSPSAWLQMLGFAFFVPCLVGWLALKTQQKCRGQNQSLSPMSEPAFLIGIPLLILHVLFYAEFIHPKIPAQLGGGRSARVYLKVKPSADVGLTDLVEFKPGTNGFSGPFELILESGSRLILKSPTSSKNEPAKVFDISRDVASVIMFGE